MNAAKKKIYVTVVLTLTSFIISLVLVMSGALDGFEMKAYDQFSRYFNPTDPGKDIIIIEVDQQSLDAFRDQGVTFPWPRQIYAPIIEYLSEADAVFMDILFSEPSSYGVEDDEVLAAAIKKASNVYLPVFLSKEKKPVPARDLEFIQMYEIKEKFRSTSQYASLLTPVNELKESVAGTGNVMIRPDRDGIYRRVPLSFDIGGITVPNFVLYYLLANHKITINEGSFFSNGIKVPLQEGQLLLRFFRNRDPFPRLSALEVVNAYLALLRSDEPSLTKEYFKEKIVLIGYTAAGLKDIKATPITSTTSGVYIHATALENLLNGNFIRPAHKIYTMVMIIVLCFSVPYFVLRHPSIVHNLSFLLLCYFIISGVVAGLFGAGHYLHITAPLSTLIISFIAASIYSYATEGKERRFIRNTFSQYMDGKIVDHILTNPELIKPGGQRKKITVFFTDIAGFTAMTEKSPPERTARVLHTILNSFTDVIIENNGVIDKYIGDGIMAFWGAPIASSCDELNACRAALHCSSSIDAINESFRSEGLNEINVRIGLHTGEAVVGNLGSDRIYDYTAVGDTINLASRLEGVNKVFNTRIIVSESAVKGTGDSLLTRELGLIEVKGRGRPVRVFELISEMETPDTESKRIVSLFNHALDLFRSKEWDGAIAAFDDILDIFPHDGPSLYYKNLSASLSQEIELTEGWDIIKMTMK